MAKQRILLVDDHEVVRLGLRALLERHPQFDVIAEASTAREAIDRVENYSPDVVVMDIRLPGGSGIEACRAHSDHRPPGFFHPKGHGSDRQRDAPEHHGLRARRNTARADLHGSPPRVSTPAPAGPGIVRARTGDVGSLSKRHTIIPRLLHRPGYVGHRRPREVSLLDRPN